MIRRNQLADIVRHHCTRCALNVKLLEKEVAELMDPSLLEIAMSVAWRYLGRPYIWGGDDPIRGFDCSGYCIEILKSVGLLPREGDWTAQALYDYFSHKKVTEPEAGCLVFWHNQAGDKIIHVEFCLNRFLAIGASGGGSATTTVENAIDQNAYIKIRPMASRARIYGYVNPFKEG